MDTAHEHRHGPLESTDEWNARYLDNDGRRIWSGDPNDALVAEVADLTPGWAADLGCGEGADAIWLASHGWRVTGIDISDVALERAAEAARGAGVHVEWVHTDFVADPPPSGAFDLVISMYPAIPKSAAEAAIVALTEAVAPGGTLLFTWHVVSDPDVPRSHGFDPDDYLQPGDVAAGLPAGWTIQVHEVRERETPSSGRSPHADDVILRARREGPSPDR